MSSSSSESESKNDRRPESSCWTDEVGVADVLLVLGGEGSSSASKDMLSKNRDDLFCCKDMRC